MAKKINIRQWIIRHPFNIACPTDFKYLKIANDLLRIVCLSDWGREMDEYDRTSLALDLSLYFEDVVSDFGLWKSFITKHKELYNKYLPFYDINEDHYYTDEVNVEDICFLIWSHRMGTQRNIFINPENTALVELGKAVYKYLDEQFENVPINDTLKERLFDREKLNDFYYVKSILIWLVQNSYLQSFYITDDLIEDCCDSYMKSTMFDWNMAEYTVSSMIAVNEKIGPLAIKATEWFAIMCMEAGLDDIATDINNIHSSKCKVYELENYDNECLYAKGSDGANIKIDRSVFSSLDEKTLQTRRFFASDLVDYRGEWYINGSTTWTDDERLFKEEAHRLKEKEMKENLNAYDKMIKDNEGHRMLYFKNGKEMRDYLKGYYTETKGFSWPEGYESWSNVAVYIGKDSDLSICTGMACCIKDKQNPLYNAEAADDEALSLLTNSELTSREMIHYMLENKLLPDARINSIYGKKRGKELVQENIDFIVRYMRRDRY